MLNNSAINRGAINASQASSVIWVSAEWSGGNTDFVGESTQILAGHWDVNGSVDSTFGGLREVHANWKVETGSTLTATPHVIHGGRASWEAPSSFRGVITRTIPGELNLDATSVFTAIPDSIFASGNWIGNSTYTGSGNLTTYATAQWQVGLSAHFDGGVITRRGRADWAVNSSLRMEASIFRDGAFLHDGYIDFTSTSRLEEDVQHTRLYINGMFLQGTTEFTGTAYARLRSSGAWEVRSEITFNPWKIVQGAGAWSAQSELTSQGNLHLAGGMEMVVASEFSAQPNIIHQGYLSAEAVNISFEGVASILHGGAQDLFVTSKLEGVGTLIAQGQFNALSSSSFTAVASRIIQGSANWAANGGLFGGGAIVTVTPAPESRRFIISGSTRGFIIGGSGRRFTV